MSSTCKVCLPLLLFIWCFCTFVYNVLIWFTLIYKTESTHVNILYYFLTWIQCYCKVIHSSDVSVTWNWIFFLLLIRKKWVYGKFNMASFLKFLLIFMEYLFDDFAKYCQTFFVLHIAKTSNCISKIWKKMKKSCVQKSQNQKWIYTIHH